MLLKPEFNLTEKQKIKLLEVISVCPELALMHQQKEAFRNIFEVENKWKSTLCEIAKWLNKLLIIRIFNLI